MYKYEIPTHLTVSINIIIVAFHEVDDLKKLTQMSPSCPEQNLHEIHRPQHTTAGIQKREGNKSGRHSSYSQLRTVILLTQICTRTQQRYSTLRYSRLYITLSYIKLALKTLV